MSLKACIRVYLEAGGGRVSDKELNDAYGQIDADIKEAQTSGNIQKIKILWTTLFQSFLEEGLPLSALDPFLNHLSGLFSEIRAEFELGVQIADHLIDELPIGGKYEIPWDGSGRTPLQLEGGGYPASLAKALGNAVLH